MPKTSNRQVKAPYYPESVYRTLRRCLHGLIGKSDTKCAKAMGVSRQTWRSWEHTPPRNPWMVFCLYWCCYTHLHGYTGRYNSKRWKQRSQAAKELRGLRPFFEDHVPAIESIQAYSGCEKHLARLLCRRGMYFHDICTPANAGGYSPRMLQIAAEKIGVKKTTKGFGPEKETWWEWPDRPDEF